MLLSLPPKKADIYLRVSTVEPRDLSNGGLLAALATHVAQKLDYTNQPRSRVMLTGSR